MYLGFERTKCPHETNYDWAARLIINNVLTPVNRQYLINMCNAAMSRDNKHVAKEARRAEEAETDRA